MGEDLLTDNKMYIFDRNTGEKFEFATGGIVTVPEITAIDNTDYMPYMKFPNQGIITGTITVTAAMYKNIYRVAELKEKLFWAVVEQKLKHPRKKPRKINRIKKQIEKLDGWRNK